MIEKKNDRKKFGRDFFGRQKFWSAKFLVEFFFRSKKIDPKNIFQPTFFSTKMFWNFFRRKKLSMKKIWLPIPMGNFPKIPKITLRTACEHFKKQLEQKVTVYVLLPVHGTYRCRILGGEPDL